MFADMVPAAFGRLCVETIGLIRLTLIRLQPPSGGCVLKLITKPLLLISFLPAAFGRLCVETSALPISAHAAIQPPSGGCVLKRVESQNTRKILLPAAFGRLCVETRRIGAQRQRAEPAAFGRLCVETSEMQEMLYIPLNQPPSGGCVLKHTPNKLILSSTLPAAFGRLCVETLTRST